ncbi:MAG: ABC transporter ATP-binding protein [Thermoplasmata archaeon]
MLVIEGLTKTFPGKPTPALDAVSLEVRDGEILGLVGLNGAGKTSTIRIAAGIALPSSGRVAVNGFDIVRDKAEASRHLGWVPEFPNFQPNARATQQLRYYAGFHGLTGASAEKRSEELLSMLGLAEAKDRKLRTYSQGMKKRFSLAAALLSDPEVFLFDEILNGLDPQGVLQVRNLMLELRKQNRAVLLSSHILAEVEHVADRVAFVHEGKLLRTLSMEEIRSVAGTYLKVTVPDIDAAGVEYLQGLGKLDRDGDTFRIHDPRGDPADINQELVRKGYRVRAIALESRGLESLFFELVGTGKVAG